MNQQKTGMIMGTVGLALAAGAVLWATQGGGAMVGSGADKAAVEKIVREYILANPEIIPQAIDVLQKREKAKAISAVRGEIEKPFLNAAYAGNPNGDVTIVEFSDFACPYCKSTTADIERLLREDPKLKVVFRELPVLSEASNDAALMALAAASQGKYFAFHQAMFATGRPSAETIATAAKTAGLDLTAARQYAASEDARREVESNLNIARQLQFSGTPSFVVGNSAESGAIGYDELKRLIAEVRAGN